MSQALRQTLRQKRRAIPSARRQYLAQALLHQVQKTLRFEHGQKVGLFLPNDGEIDTIYIQNFLKNKGISIYLPILDGKSLKFAKTGPSLRPNRFGIDEPINTPVLGAKQLNVIFMPLVGFDQQKNRLGMGGGFYDRTLSFKRQQQRFNSPKLYGLAFDCQEVGQLKAQDWDVPLEGIITPSRSF